MPRNESKNQIIKVNTKTFPLWIQYKVDSDTLDFGIQNSIFWNFENLNSKFPNISESLKYLLGPTLPRRPSRKVILIPVSLDHPVFIPYG